MSENWFYKRELGSFDLAIYNEEGIDTMGALDLASLMIIDGNEVNYLSDVKEYYSIAISSNKWEGVNEIYFSRLLKTRQPKLEKDIKEAEVNRKRAKKGGEAKAAKIRDFSAGEED